MKGSSHAGPAATEPVRAGAGRRAASPSDSPGPSPARTLAGFHAARRPRRRLAAALLALPLLLGLAAPAAAQARNTIAFPGDTIHVAEGAQVVVTPTLRNTQSTRTYVHIRAVEPDGNLDGYEPARIGTAAGAHTWPISDRRGVPINAGDTKFLQSVVTNPGSRGRYFFIEITKVTTDGSTNIDTSVALGTPSRVTVFIVAAEDDSMPRIILSRDHFRVDEPQADNCPDDKVGNETIWTDITLDDEPGIRVERDYGPVLTTVDYKVRLDRNPGAGRVVSVEIWEPTDLDRPDVIRSDKGRGAFNRNARIHGIGWPPVRQGRISIENSPLLNRGRPVGDRRHHATYLTFTDKNWNQAQAVTVNIHCARHDVTMPLPIWHFAFRHNTPGWDYPSHTHNRNADNSPRNTSLAIAEVRVADSTGPPAITGDVDGNLVLDPDVSGYFVHSDDGHAHIIGLDFRWNNPDNSLHNDHDDANGKFAGFRVRFRTVDPPGHAVQEKFVRADFIFGNPTTTSWRAGVEANGYDHAKRFMANRPDRKYEWSVVPVDWHWNDVEAERVTRCVLMTGNTLDLTASPNCPAALQGESEGASTAAVPVPDTAVANVRATVADDASASVSWDAVEHATAYEVSWDGSGSGTAVTGILPGVTGTTTTIRHDAEEAMTLTVTVTPEYVDGNGQVVQLPSLAGTATLDVGPQQLNGGGTNGGGDGGQVQADEGESPGTVSLALPVAHWRLDGDAGDSAGSSHGTAQGGASFAANDDGGGVGSHALVLDGIDDHVDLAPHVSSLPLGDAARSVTGWFRAGAGSQRQTFLSYGPNLAGRRFSIAADRTQVVVAVSGHARGVNGLDLDDGWHHVAVTYSGGDSDGISIYLDGALQAASTLVGAPQSVDTRAGPAAIGRNAGGAHYAGSIDDVRIYNMALGAEQVLALVDEQPQTPPSPAPVTTAVTASVTPALAEGSLDGAGVALALDAGVFAATVSTSDVTASGVPGLSVSSVTRDSDGRVTATLAFDGTDFDADATLTLMVSASALAHSDTDLSATLPVTAVDEPPPPPPAVPVPAPVAHWKFDGDAGDSAGSNHGVVRNGASFTTAARVGSHALALDGGGDHVDLSPRVVWFPLEDSARSVTGWFRADAGSQGQAFFSYGPNAARQRFSVAADRTQAVVGVSGYAWGVRNLGLDDGWHHVAVTYAGGGANTFSIYVDGVLQPSSLLGGFRRSLDTRIGPATIGRSADGTSHYGGEIDDVRLYGHALSAGQVRAVAARREGARPAAAAFPVRAPTGLRQRGWSAPGMSWGLPGAAGAGMHHGAVDRGTPNLGAVDIGTPTLGVRTHVPLLPGASNPRRGGLVRIVNPSRRAGGVRIVAVDDAGRRSDPVVLGMGAGETLEFTSRDLEWGGGAMGSGESTGPGIGDWRLEVASDLEIDVLGYVRAADGTLSGMGGVAPSADNAHRVALFHPADSPDAAGLLRLTNRGGEALMADITGIDDTGASPGGKVSVEVAADGSVLLTAAELEAGGADLLGALGDGGGQWRLDIASDGDLAVMNLAETPDGHLANLSNATAMSVPAREAHVVDRFPSSSDISNEQGVVRIVNSSEEPASVRIEPHDSTGWRYAPLTLTLGAGEAASLGALDLELGNVAKGLAGSAGPGAGGAWRLAISSDSDIEVLTYTRTSNGLPRVPPGDTAAEGKPR